MITLFDKGFLAVVVGIGVLAVSWMADTKAGGERLKDYDLANHDGRKQKSETALG